MTPPPVPGVTPPPPSGQCVPPPPTGFVPPAGVPPTVAALLGYNWIRVVGRQVAPPGRPVYTFNKEYRLRFTHATPHHGARMYVELRCSTTLAGWHGVREDVTVARASVPVIIGSDGIDVRQGIVAREWHRGFYPNSTPAFEHQCNIDIRPGIRPYWFTGGNGAPPLLNYTGASCETSVYGIQ